MEFWDLLSWDRLHDPVRTVRVVPGAIQCAVADLRKALCDAMLAATTEQEQARLLKAILFSDRLLFAAARRRRGGARGQRGETLARTLARRIRLAWEGCWDILWQESEVPPGELGAAAPSEAQQLDRDIQSINEALAEEDIREASES